MAHLMRGKWLTAASMNTSQMKELDSLLQQLETILITPEPT
jgi:hypothetical protein